MQFIATCPICGQQETFFAEDAYHSWRDSLHAPSCQYGYAATRERALAEAIFSLYSRDEMRTIAVHEIAPANRGISAWLKQNCVNLTQSGYFPDRSFAEMVGDLRNENMEKQTFAGGSFALVVHLD